MSSVATNSIVSLETPALGSVPPLQSGDHLTRDEFERRYKASPEQLKAELIEGIVYIMVPPVTESGHARPHFRFIGWLSIYEAYTPGTIGGPRSLFGYLKKRLQSWIYETSGSLE